MLNKLKILLVIYDNESYISYFPVGLAYLASACRDAGHDVVIYNQDVYHYPDCHLTLYLDNNYFDVVGLGACGGYYQYRKIKSLCQAIKAAKKSPFLVLGGHLVSPDPEFFLRECKCDAICIGEGEVTLVELLDTHANGQELGGVRGLAFLDKSGTYVRNEDRPLISNVDDITMPAYDLFPMDHYALLKTTIAQGNARTIPIPSGRGCPYTCNFCYRMDKGFRPRSCEGLLREIRHLMDSYNIRHFNFCDELLMSSVKRTKELCEGFLASGLEFTWSCNGRLNFATPELLGLMKKAGCVFVNYGIESVNDNALRNMNKALTVKQIISGVEATLDTGISPGLNIIFGNIGEDSECLKNDVDFLLKYEDHSKLRTIRPVTPYPGSLLFDYAVEKGLIRDVEDFYKNKHVNSDLLTVNFTNMTDDEFYEELFQANTVLLDNYCKNLENKNRQVLERLYKLKDGGFRGFRQT